MTLEILRMTSATPQVIELIAALDDELSAHYPPEQRHSLSLDSLFQSHIHFMVARDSGNGVGCGGIALFDDFAELKRFYVKPGLRGRGIADAILAQLSAVASAAGHKSLRLETGTDQHAVLSFYERNGFSRCAAFEPYASLPPHTIATSVFMEKTLG